MRDDTMLRPFWNLPSMKLMSFLDDEDTYLSATNPSGLSISEDDSYVYVEAAVPGVEPDDVEMTFHNGILKIHGKSKKAEKQDRKNYKTMTSEFSYQIALRDIDPNVDPEARCKNGVMEVTFAKSKAAQPKQIKVQK